MTLGSHQTSVGKTQVHITPRWIINRLGPFDLELAAADPRPWNCAQRNFTECDDGLAREWNGQMHRVAVLADGFAWNGETYPSLTKVAVAITGTRWSGPRFFGVDKPPKGIKP